jgi:hypothetical protein
MFLPPDRYAQFRRWAALAAAGLAAATTLLVVSAFGEESSAAYADPAAAGHRIPTATPSVTIASGWRSWPRPASSRPTAPATSTGTSTATPQPPATPSPAAGPTSRRTSSHGGVVPYGRPSTSTADAAAGTPDEADPAGRVPDWTSYLPAPQTGMKIFLAGLIGLAVAITGLAALALRRREY